MNKKFTFMVAALLAAGGFSANAAVTGEGITKEDNGKSYHVVLAASTTVADDDVVLGSSVNKNSGVISYDISKTISSSELPDFDSGKENQYIWKVVVETVNGETNVTLVNAETGLPLAVNLDNNGALVVNTQEYSNGSELDSKWVLDDITLNYDGENSHYLSVNTGLELAASGKKVLLVEVENAPVSDITELKNIGTGVKMDLEGTIDGEDLFKEVSFVTVSAGDLINSSFKTENGAFLIQVGKAAYSNYDLKENEDHKKAFKAAEFIVLTPKAAEGVTPSGSVGYTYTKVKGEKLEFASDGTAQTEGKQAAQNAIFTAEKNANHEGKYAFKSAGIWTVDASGNYEDTNATDKPSYIGYADAGVGGAEDALASAENPSWITVTGGSAVEVKNLVKGQWVVNILASEDKNSTVMKRVLYATQATSKGATISGSTDETNAHKDAVYAQWVVSANKDANTVTFINRESGFKIENVTLFTTPKEGVYSLSTAATGITASESGKALTECYVELRTVENTSQWDGFLKVSDEDINSTEYSLSVENTEDMFAETELAVVPNEDKDGLIVGEDDNVDKAFKFKLSPASIKVDDATKKDTVMVNVISYGYYKDGVYTPAKDTLKAISYNFVDLQNVGDKNKVYKASSGNDLAIKKDGDETAVNVIFRKVGEQYQIALKGDYTATNNMLKLDSEEFKFTGTIKANTSTENNNQLFSLNAIKFEAPAYDVPESHIALQINGAYLGSKADGNAIMTNDTSLLKSTVADASFSFYAFSADKEEAKTPSYYLSSNGKMMYSPANEIAAINKEISELSPVFDAEEIAELEAKRDAYMKNGEVLVKFQRAKYEAADKVALADTTYTKAEDLKPFKFNVYDIDGQAVLKNGSSNFVKVLNDVVVFTNDEDQAAKFDVVAAEAPTSNEGVSATEVKVVANNGSIVVKNAAGKNVVVSTILGQVVANEVLTSDNATINVPAGIVVVAVEGESFKVNVK